MPTQIRILQGDITALDADAVINSANNDLIMGAGVSGALRRIGGPSIQEECHAIGTIPLGEAVVTTGGSLKCKYVIHAATNPLGLWASAKWIRLALKNALKRAVEKEVKTLLIPAIGAGSGGFAVDQCATVLYDELLEHVKNPTTLETATFVLFDEKTFKVFEEKFMRKFPEHWTEMTGRPLPELPPEDDKKPLPEDLIPIVRPKPPEPPRGRRDDRRGPPGPRPGGPAGPRPGGPQQQQQQGQGPRRDRGPRRGRGPRPPRPPRPGGPPPPQRPQGGPPPALPPPPAPPAPPPAPIQ